MKLGDAIGLVWDRTPLGVRATLLRWLPPPRFRVGALALLVRGSDEVLLLRHRFRVGGAWGLPGGWVERREDPRDAIVRELREELALVVAPERPRLVHLESRRGRSHLELFFRIDGADAELGDVPRNFEFDDLGWFSPPTLPEDMLPLHRELVRRLLAEPAAHPAPR